MSIRLILTSKRFSNKRIRISGDPGGFQHIAHNLYRHQVRRLHTLTLCLFPVAWGENWSVSDMEYSAEYNQITVWVCRPDCYKAFFDADTLEYTGTKC